MSRGEQADGREPRSNVVFTHMRNSKGLERLIVGCLDDEHTLDYESGIVDAARHLVLARMASERASFAEHLRTLGEPGARESVSWSGRLRELARSVRVLMGGCNSGDSILECRRSCDRTEALYDKAVRLQWSQPILPTLLVQRDRIRLSRGELLAIQF
jgi:hypothetical protein